MSILLPVAFALIVLSVAAYIITRRQRHGGLAGGLATVSPPRTSAAVGAGRKFTEAEVAEHNSSEDLWLIINDKVYNFTDYFFLHPGGDAILRNAGKDSTVGFSGSQHPARVWDMVSPDFDVIVNGGTHASREMLDASRSLARPNPFVAMFTDR